MKSLPDVEHLSGGAGAKVLRRTVWATLRSTQKAHYLAALTETPIQELIENTKHTRLEVLRVGHELIPITVNDGFDEDCYLVSPVGYYLKYAREELNLLDQPLVAPTLDAVLNALTNTFRNAQFNRVIYINNWLTSTPLRTRPSNDVTRAIIHHLRARYPTHALVYRGILEDETDTFRAFRATKMHPIINRPVMIWGNRHRIETRETRRQRKSDLRALASFTIHNEIGPRMWQDIPHLYRSLYNDRYSNMNPMYTEKFFRIQLASELFRSIVLTRGGPVLGFATSFVDDDGALVFLAVGRDTSLDPAKVPVYRALVASMFHRAEEEVRPLFLSTGVAEFKRQRGAVERMEFDAVHTANLPAASWGAWHCARLIFDIARRVVDTRQL